MRHGYGYRTKVHEPEEAAGPVGLPTVAGRGVSAACGETLRRPPADDGEPQERQTAAGEAAGTEDSLGTTSTK